MKTFVSGILFFGLMISSHLGMTQLQVTIIQNNTSCTIPNGTASASVGGATAGYTFQWYDIALNPLGVTGPTINNLSAGNYSVIAGEDATGIQTMMQFMISDETVLPQAVVESIPNTSCTPFGNGALLTTVAGNASDYSYAWYQGADPAGSLISSNSDLVAASAGVYTLQVTHLLSGCYTRLTAQILDQPAFPLVNVVVTNNTNCDATPNGTLNAVTEENAQQYNFAWYTIDMTPLGITGPFATNLAAGNYAVTVTDGITGCVSTASAAIYDDCNSRSSGFSGVGGNVITNEKKPGNSTLGYYPNPASETLWVSSVGPAELVLINNRGEIVLRQNVYLRDYAFPLDVSGLKPGKYILKANEDGAVTNFQIIIKK